MRKTLVIIFSLVLTLLVTSRAYADRRSYVWTYAYQTVAKGQAEFEYYVTNEVPHLDKSATNTWKHWFELEYGLTDRWDIGMYQQFKQTNGSSSSFEYDGFKIKTRYRLGESGQFFVDPLLYLEYIRNDNLSNPNVFEGKLVLAKDIGQWNMAYNQILEQEIEKGGSTEHEYAFGLSYEVKPSFKVGLETKGSYSDKEYYLGPTISWAAEKFWLTLGAAGGLNNKSDDFQARAIVGIPF